MPPISNPPHNDAVSFGCHALPTLKQAPMSKLPPPMKLDRLAPPLRR